jgi:hypothetical protein
VKKRILFDWKITVYLARHLNGVPYDSEKRQDHDETGMKIKWNK